MEMMEEGQNQPKISPKQIISNKEMLENGEEDRISELQDCLLLEILSRLPSTKYAIRTGALSKRWNHLWTLVPTLIFKSTDGDLFRLLKLNKFQIPNHIYNFVSSVDKILTQCRQSKLKKFQVDGSYDIRFRSQVNYWVRYATSRNVEELSLKFPSPKDEFLLDQSFFINTCFTHLTLSGCKLNPRGGISSKNLRSLYIVWGHIDDDLIENILSGSPELETLVLERCYGYSQIHITSKSVKKLVLIGYFDPYNPDAENRIEINAPHILSLTIRYLLAFRKIMLLNVSSLLEVNLDYIRLGLWGTNHKEAEEETVKGFILSLHHVKDLKIGSHCSKVMSSLEAKGFVFPSNLKFPAVIPHWTEVVF